MHIGSKSPCQPNGFYGKNNKGKNVLITEYVTVAHFLFHEQHCVANVRTTVVSDTAPKKRITKNGATKTLKNIKTRTITKTETILRLFTVDRVC